MHVLIHERVQDEELSLKSRAQLAEIRGVVASGVVPGSAEVPFGVPRIVEPPIDDRRPCDSNPETRRSAQESEPGHEAAVTMTVDADALAVDVREACQIVHARQLIDQLELAELPRYRLLEGPPAAWRPTIVQLEYDDAAVGKMLPQQASRPAILNGLSAGAAVDHHDDGMAFSRSELARRQQRAVERIAARSRDLHQRRRAKVKLAEIRIERAGELTRGSGPLVVNDRTRWSIDRGVHVDPALAISLHVRVVDPDLRRQPSWFLGSEPRRAVQLSFERAFLGRREEHATVLLVDGLHRFDIPVARRDLSDARAVLRIQKFEVSVPGALARPQQARRPLEQANLRKRNPTRRRVVGNHTRGEKRGIRTHQLEFFLIARECLKEEGAPIGCPSESPEIVFFGRCTRQPHEGQLACRELHDAQADDRILAAGRWISLHHDVGASLPIAEHRHFFDAPLVDLQKSDAIAAGRPPVSALLSELFLPIEIAEPAGDPARSALRQRRAQRFQWARRVRRAERILVVP